jgi:hypothetical protein
LDHSRWTLDLLGEVCEWLAGYSRSGIWRVLQRLGFSRQQVQDHLHSPDPCYDAKCAAIAAHRDEAQTHPGQIVLCYLDEVTLLRQPTHAPDYAGRGGPQPRAERSLKEDTPSRLVATLDGGDGRVCFRSGSKITVPTLVTFYRDLVGAYPDAERLYVVLDNWPVHFHPDLLVALEPQEPPFPFPRPRSWPTEPHETAVKKWGDLSLPIQLVPLPTYASWLNPIEKLWRWLRQDLGHRHPWADDLAALRAALVGFLTQFANGSDALLRSVGLPLPN